jgi:hypothetical protein
MYAVVAICIVVALLGARAWLKWRARRAAEYATCLSADETNAILADDPDGFVASLTKWDLKARGVRTPEAYMRRISSAGKDFTDAERFIVYRLAREADAKFAGITEIDGRAAAALKWTVAKVSENYERGMAHTRRIRADRIVIFLPESALRESRDDILDTLVHEKVHVYQKAYPIETAAWIQARGFTRWMRRVDLAATGVRVRSNCDLDEWVYVTPDARRPMLIEYDTETNDETQAAMEHPYELMAYGISKTVSKAGSSPSIRASA